MLRVAGMHGIFNLDRKRSVPLAAANLSAIWSAALTSSMAHVPMAVQVAYYADCIAGDTPQGGNADNLPFGAQQELAEWVLALGAPHEVAEGVATVPVRQIVSWISRRYGLAYDTVDRFVDRFLREVPAYLGGPGRQNAQDRLATVLAEHRPHVLVAHSLGSVVAFETLCANPELGVDLLITLGSPLGLPNVVFHKIQPPLVRRPPQVRRWVNIADIGDFVAAPPRLGDVFDVDAHHEVNLGLFEFHRASRYLAAAVTAEEIGRLA
ncbi:hypothetical protein ACIA47_17825 [Micromonospora sp. NPDC051227]|uniref:hypothetical protein n=1 Tax=Micromonospora sp. NPDC051227 TaxID=3364285 RepID=UPI00379311CA